MSPGHRSRSCPRPSRAPGSSRAPSAIRARGATSRRPAGGPAGVWFHGLTLTATITGRLAAGNAAGTSFRIFASSGQRLRQTGSMKAITTGRPRSERRLIGRPAWSRSAKSGAWRVPAGERRARDRRRGRACRLARRPSPARSRRRGRRPCRPRPRPRRARPSATETRFDDGPTPTCRARSVAAAGRAGGGLGRAALLPAGTLDPATEFEPRARSSGLRVSIRDEPRPRGLRRRRCCDRVEDDESGMWSPVVGTPRSKPRRPQCPLNATWRNPGASAIAPSNG